MLVEGDLFGVPLRLEVGRNPDLVRAEVAGAGRLLDLRSGRIFPDQGAAVAAADLPEAASLFRYRLALWGGRRLTIAGEKGGYHVMTLLGRTCGEVVVADWTRPLIGPLVRAVELLQRSEATLRPRERDACGAIPFRAYASRGWPLLAGWEDQKVFETRRIAMDHQPDERIFQLP
ncbi:hypothetical protein [Geminicoccus roseus]|uniref:hypothetical protein n=1 Tax=Geminicoccus roseus TaxID=404900 RepID=UPI000404ADF5|nr:hypothetical protein [Geminicoccus roseus]